MRDRARAKIDEVRAKDSRHLSPPDVEKKTKAIADRAVAAQTT